MLFYLSLQIVFVQKMINCKLINVRHCTIITNTMTPVLIYLELIYKGMSPHCNLLIHSSFYNIIALRTIFTFRKPNIRKCHWTEIMTNNKLMKTHFLDMNIPAKLKYTIHLFDTSNRKYPRYARWIEKYRINNGINHEFPMPNWGFRTYKRYEGKYWNNDLN